jgi:hypothetical protein
MGLRALWRAPWLLAGGLLVGLAGQLLLWPAWATAWALLGRAAVLAVETSPLDPLAPLRGVVAAATAPRFLAIVAGLLVAGVLAGALFRVAFLAGALPTLAGAVAADPAAPRFATGLAYRFPRVLAAAALAFALRLGAWLFALALAVAAARITVAAAGGGGGPLLAAAVAAALTLAVAVPVALGTVADASVARAAVLGDRPAEALAAGADRFAARPGTFVLAGIVLAVAGIAGAVSLQAVGSVATGFMGGRVHPLVALGPTLMVGAAGAVLAAAVDLVRLGTVAALACAREDAGGQ